MENTTIKDVILDKKLSKYGCRDNDFLASGELTVTITLNEYRDLVEKCATAQSRIDQAYDNKYERDTENTKLKEENSALKAELYELKKALDKTEDVCEGNGEEQKWKYE